MDLLRGWIGMFIEKSLGGNYESGCAEAALLGVIFHERGLHGVQLLALHQAFDGDNALSLRLDGQNRTGVNRRVFHEYRAGAARAPVANPLGPGDFKIFAQCVE